MIKPEAREVLQGLENLDGDMPQYPEYISDNTDDEVSHAAFLNAYLISRGEQPGGRRAAVRTTD